MVALSIKIVATCVVQLVGTRIALTALGDDGFGLYNLLAGIIVLFTFLTGSLLISTQRYLSIAIGEGDDGKLCSIFNVSLLVHAIFAIGIFVSLFALKTLLFTAVLNINEGFKESASVMYNIIALSTSFTILSIPYAALMNAHEDMVVFAGTEVISLVVKLFAAISLLFVHWDLLLTYTSLMCFSVILNATLKYWWCDVKYLESRIDVHLMKNKPLLREMISFVSWNALGSAAVVVRNQGVAVLLNVFYGTAINAAYGIANQVNSLVLSFATTLTTVFTPSIVQSRGEGNNKRMLDLAVFSSKLSFFVSSLIALPILVYLSDILVVWLKDVPLYTSEFVFWIVLAFLVQQLYPGINRAIYAVGQIRAYQIWTAIILVSIIPIGYVVLKLGFDVLSIMIMLFVLQVLTLFATVYYAKKNCGLDVHTYIVDSIIKPCVLFITVYAVFNYFNLHIYQVQINHFILWTLMNVLMCLIYTSLYYFVVLNKTEQHQMYSLISRYISNMRSKLS